VQRRRHYHFAVDFLDLQKDPSSSLAIATDDDLNYLCEVTDIPDDIILLLRSRAPECVSLAPGSMDLSFNDFWY
jgi:hypothetical protein